MNLGTAEVIRADSRHLPIADNSVDLVITSPPYFALRSYQDGGEHYDGQIGAEQTPDEFVTSLLEVTAECVRVLKPTGSLWVNLGDKYVGHIGTTSGHKGGKLVGGLETSGTKVGYRKADYGTIRPKSLIGIPWRYALRCIDDLGLILRAEVIWSKPNGLPESVTDRVRRSHEQWFHFTLQPRYFSAVDEIREEHAPAGLARRTYAFNVNDAQRAGNNPVLNGEGMRPANPLGKLPGSVWTIPTEPLRVPDHLGVDHFAAFPTEWPKRIIQGWSPAGVCVECGEGRRPVTSGKSEPNELAALTAPRRIIGYDCACDPSICRSCGLANEPHDCFGAFRCCETCTHGTRADTSPAVVLDPFGGTGTTAMVAKALGRHGISVDMSADYCRLAEWRTNDRNQLAKVLDVAKAEQQPVDQLSMFDLLDNEGGAA